MGIGPGYEVIIPAFTWVATANVVAYCGATPVFADVDRTTYNIDPSDVVRRVSSRTKAVIAVHLFGLCADMDALQLRCRKRFRLSKVRARLGPHRLSAGALGSAASFLSHPRKS